MIKYFAFVCIFFAIFCKYFLKIFLRSIRGDNSYFCIFLHISAYFELHISAYISDCIYQHIMRITAYGLAYICILMNMQICTYY